MRNRLELIIALFSTWHHATQTTWAQFHPPKDHIWI